MDVMALLRYGGWARPLPFHFDECVSPIEPNIMPRLYGELYWVSVIGHVRGKNQYECVILYVSIKAWRVEEWRSCCLRYVFWVFFLEGL